MNIAMIPDWIIIGLTMWWGSCLAVAGVLHAYKGTSRPPKKPQRIQGLVVIADANRGKLTFLPKTNEH